MWTINNPLAPGLVVFTIIGMSAIAFEGPTSGVFDLWTFWVTVAVVAVLAAVAVVMVIRERAQ